MQTRRSAGRVSGVIAVLLVILGGGLWHPAQAQRVDDPCANPANPVVAENCLPGTGDWIVDNALFDIEGYAHPMSVLPGESLGVYVNTTAAAFDLDVYRLGYYGGDGGRLMAAYPAVSGGAQPACHHDAITGLTSCANWRESLALTVPDDWISGVYVAKLTRPDTGGEAYALFVVRDPARAADLLVQVSVFTHHAYNPYGGKSIYNFNSGECCTDSLNVRASRVSLRRPVSPRMDFENDVMNTYFRAEYPMMRWLEMQGYHVAYSTDLDTHYAGAGADNALTDYPAVLAVGHDEYWTQQMFDAVRDARDAGTNIGIFSANTAYWRVRLEADPWTGEADTVMVCYKSIEDGQPDPSGHPTTTFRDPDGVNLPENSLYGTMYIGDNDTLYFPLRVSAELGKDRIYRHTDLQTMPSGTFIDIGPQMIGWEWDAVVENGHTPASLDILAETPVSGFILADAGNYLKGYTDSTVMHTTRFTAESGAVVFAAGTIQWSWGLGAFGTALRDPDPYVQQITVNVLADLGALAASPTADVILDGEDGRIESPPERFVTALSVPSIDNLSVDTSASGLDAGRVAVITWTHDIPARAQLWFGMEPERARDPREDFATYTTAHRADLDKLIPGQTYHYRILAMAEDGGVAFSQEGTFETPSNVMVTAGMWVLDAFRSARCYALAYPIPALAIFGVIWLVLIAVVVLAVRGRNGARAARP